MRIRSARERIDGQNARSKMYTRRDQDYARMGPLCGARPFSRIAGLRPFGVSAYSGPHTLGIAEYLRMRFT